MSTMRFRRWKEGRGHLLLAAAATKQVSLSMKIESTFWHLLSQLHRYKVMVKEQFWKRLATIAALIFWLLDHSYKCMIFTLKSDWIPNFPSSLSNDFICTIFLFCLIYLPETLSDAVFSTERYSENIQVKPQNGNLKFII